MVARFSPPLQSLFLPRILSGDHNRPSSFELRRAVILSVIAPTEFDASTSVERSLYRVQRRNPSSPDDSCGSHQLTKWVAAMHHPRTDQLAGASGHRCDSCRAQRPNCFHPLFIPNAWLKLRSWIKRSVPRLLGQSWLPISFNDRDNDE